MIVFNKETRTMSQNVICSQKLFLTADKEAVVAEDDDRAAFLYATPGDEIPAEMAEKFGLVDGALPEPKKAKAETKPAKAAETKPAGEGETKDVAQ